jgi:hypothetical protein
MPAREKLNAAYFHGSLVLAALAGYVCSSWVVFGVALVTLLIGNVMARDIRPVKRRR